MAVLTNLVLPRLLACRGCDVRAHTSGVTVTLIDFTLSRLIAAGGEAVFCDLAADPELFKGTKGDVQASIAEPPGRQLQPNLSY
jgi:hypothetical protein